MDVIEIRGGREVWKKRVGVERERSPMKKPQLDAGLDVMYLSTSAKWKMLSLCIKNCPLIRCTGRRGFLFFFVTELFVTRETPRTTFKGLY
jgi:hypothetical protein